MRIAYSECEIQKEGHRRGSELRHPSPKSHKKGYHARDLELRIAHSECEIPAKRVRIVAI